MMIRDPRNRRRLVIRRRWLDGRAGVVIAWGIPIVVAILVIMRGGIMDNAEILERIGLLVDKAENFQEFGKIRGMPAETVCTGYAQGLKELSHDLYVLYQELKEAEKHGA